MRTAEIHCSLKPILFMIRCLSTSIIIMLWLCLNLFADPIQRPSKEGLWYFLYDLGLVSWLRISYSKVLYSLIHIWSHKFSHIQSSIIISQVKYNSGNESKTAKHMLHDEVEQVEITLAEKLSNGSNLTLMIEFKGVLDDKILRGLYLSSYPTYVTLTLFVIVLVNLCTSCRPTCTCELL